MNIIIFAGIYKTIERLSTVHHFLMLASGGELLFCAHHGREHAAALAKVAVDIQDESQRLTKSE